PDVPDADVPTAPGAAASGGAGTIRTAPRGRWTWPLDPTPRVVHGFDPPAQRWLPGHRGVDLAIETDADVLAADDGVVVFAGVVAGKPALSIDHAGGLRSTYEPVTAIVDTGMSVTRAQVVGTLASADGHCAPAACLHWGARRGKNYLDPLSLVGARPTILLPLR
ncbi:MAG: peptidoglycan DD-metalloendopeptidase family protein, partial [Dermatophilaceae bacterium]